MWLKKNFIEKAQYSISNNQKLSFFEGLFFYISISFFIIKFFLKKKKVNFIILIFKKKKIIKMKKMKIKKK